jgi:hypothetical protein
LYDDSEKEMRVDAENIRFALRKSKFKLDDKIEANYKGKGRWFPGKVSKVHKDGTFDISYDDGESECNVDDAFIRKLESESKSDDSVDRRRLATLTAKAISNVRSICRKFQKHSIDKTCRKVFEEYDETPPVTYISRREFKIAFKSIYDGSKPGSNAHLDDEISEDEINLFLDFEIYCTFPILTFTE